MREVQDARNASYAIENGNVVIYADVRERNARVVTILKKFCTVTEAQLKVGDYILSDRVGVERKSSADFVQSIVDRRLFAQVGELKSNFKKPLLIIEGNDVLDSARNVHPNAIRGAIASVSVDHGVPIIWTASQTDTAHQLYTIARREQLEGKKLTGIRGKKKPASVREMQEFIVAGLPKISTQKARNLLAHFGTPEKVFTAGEAELKKVDGIGDGLAKQIRSLVTEKYKK